MQVAHTRPMMAASVAALRSNPVKSVIVKSLGTSRGFLIRTFRPGVFCSEGGLIHRVNHDQIGQGADYDQDGFQVL